MEAEIQQQKKFPNSSIPSLSHSWLTPGRASGHRRLALVPMDRQLPDGYWSTRGQVKPWGKRPNLA